MVRPYRVSFGLPGVIALSLPPVALCLASIALSSGATKYAGLCGIALGLVIYYFQNKPAAVVEIEPAPTAEP